MKSFSCYICSHSTHAEAYSQAPRLGRDLSDQHNKLMKTRFCFVIGNSVGPRVSQLLCPGNLHHLARVFDLYSVD